MPKPIRPTKTQGGSCQDDWHRVLRISNCPRCGKEGVSFRIGMSLDAALDDFNEWFDGLSDLDQANFQTLINLPTAATVIDNLNRRNPGLYSRMAVFAWAMKEAAEKTGINKLEI